MRGEVTVGELTARPVRGAVPERVHARVSDCEPGRAGLGRYLYAVCRAWDAVETSARRVLGLSGMPLEFVHHGELAAVVSTVPLAAFGGESLRSNLRDVAWLEDVVSTHEEVVRAVGAAGVVVPFRLGAVYADDEAVSRHVGRFSIPLRCALDRVEGCGEWNVRILVPSVSIERSPAPRVHGELARQAAASKLLPLQDARLSGQRGTMLLNAAYLVSAHGQGAFEACLEQMAVDHPSLTLDCRGPRPPYSFAMLEPRAS